MAPPQEMLKTTPTAYVVFKSPSRERICGFPGSFYLAPLWAGGRPSGSVLLIKPELLILNLVWFVASVERLNIGSGNLSPTAGMLQRRVGKSSSVMTEAKAAQNDSTKRR